ncbi:peptidase family m28 family [Moniliophthora roreri]|nr:peptidase family m28 family [Moniliophthora roreri]
MGLIQTIFGFHSIPVSTVLVLIYAIVWLSVYITDQLAAVPANLPGKINLTEAYLDLERLTLRPHPYNSHANDDVRDFILDTITKRNPNVEIVYDTNSTGTWVGATVVGVPAMASYFEGNNILVRIPGTAEQSTPGVLFSAHWDSVSTAPGATDDGIAVSILIQLVSFFHKHPPRRTVIFNINNGEEDGLHGAHAFLLHPWASEVRDFVNLEGAAAGGPVLPFRATGESIMRAYRKGVGNVHANVLSADAFERGVVRSGTDYQVYTADEMRGVDLAFYRGRARYHTKYDAVPWTEGRERAVWSMIEAAYGTGATLANEGSVEASLPAERKGVWFDLFGSALLLFTLDSMFVFNIVTLVVGPIVLLLLLTLQVAVSRKRTRSGQWLVFSSTPMARALWTSARYWFALIVVVGVQAGWVAGWVKLNPFMVHTYPYTVLTSSFTLSFLIFTFVVNVPLPAKMTGNTQHLSPSPLPLLLHTYFLTYVLLIVSTVGISKLHISGSYFITAWNLLIWVACVFGVIFGKGGLVFSGKQTFVISEEDLNEESDELRSASAGLSEDRQGQAPEENVNATERTPLLSRSDSTSSHTPPKSIEPDTQVHATELQTTYTWLPLILIVLPLPLVLLSQITIILVGALPQTLADGNSALAVYIPLAGIAGVAGLFGWPFVICGSSSPENNKGLYMGGLHRYVVLLLIVVFVVTTLPGWLAGGFYGDIADRGLTRWTESHGLYPPFGPETPLKVFFQQTVELSPPEITQNDGHILTIQHESGNTTVKMETTLTASGEFLEHWIVPRIPSALTAITRAKGGVTCSSLGVDPRKIGLSKCAWPSGEGMIPEPGSDDSDDNDDGGPWHWRTSPNPWFSANIRNQLFNDSSAPHTMHPVRGASIFIRGTNTRNCRVYFDQPVARYRVRDSEHGLDVSWDTQKGYSVPETGLNEVSLWSRDWGKNFVLDVIWKEQDLGFGVQATQKPFHSQRQTQRTGKVACEWAEYESGMAGLERTVPPGTPMKSSDSKLEAKIPAFEEILSFLPRWAVVSKLTDGLVEVWQTFGYTIL